MINVSRFDRIAVVGAFDRHNYGDLLFPIVSEVILRQKGFMGKIEYFSTTKSDMKKYGAKNTIPLRELFLDGITSRDLIIVAGGEVLPASWVSVLSDLLSPFKAKVFNRITAILGDRISSYIFSRLMRVNSRLPFVFSRTDFSHQVKVAYNAVGGSHAKDASEYIRETLLKKLSKSDFISVRDSQTKKFLDSNAIANVQLSPDCAILLSKIFPLDKLKISVGAMTLKLSENFKNGYLCFQSSMACADGNESIIHNQLVEFRKKTGLGVVLFSIGRATGHSDQEAVKLILSTTHNGADKFMESSSDSIFDIMWIIANAKLYAGTSLHGAITAASYGVPIIALCPDQVPKLPAFLTTWVDSKLFEITSYSGISCAAEKLISSEHTINSNQLIFAQDKAISNFSFFLSL